jgi:hypothetical protein
MIHFQLGDLHLEKRYKRAHWRGEYTLMIEIAEWSITRWNRRLANNCSRPRQIDQVLPLLLSRRIKAARLTHPNSVLTFDSGFALELGVDARLYGPWGLCNWTLFHGDDDAITFEYKSPALRLVDPHAPRP